MNPKKLEDYGLRGLGWTSLMFARVYSDETEFPSATSDEAKRRKERTLHIPLYCVLIKELEYHDDVYKLPGGRAEPYEPTPDYTAVREFREETGISIARERAVFVSRWLARNKLHYKCLFRCDLYERELRQMNNRERGNEGEQPFAPTMDRLREIIREGGFLKEHLSQLYFHELLFREAFEAA